MTHRNAISHGDGAEFARGAAGGRDALLDRLGLTHQRDIAGRSLVPARRHADERLVDLLGGQPHGIKIRAMGRPLRALRHMPARQSLLDAGLGVHRYPVSQVTHFGSRETPHFPSPWRASWPFRQRTYDFTEGCG